MNRYLIYIFGMFIPLSLMVIYPQISYAQDSNECKSVILSAQKKLQSGRRLRVSSQISNFRDNTQSYPDHPTNRPQDYLFAMEGSAATSIMKSTQLMNAISTKIIQSCSSVGSVTFGISNSGAFRSTGIFPDGQIKIFKCAEEFGIYPGRANTGQSPKWGMQYCSL
jgi:hypothetical protein